MDTIVIDIQAKYSDHTKDLRNTASNMDRFSKSIESTKNSATSAESKLQKMYDTAKRIGKTAISIPVKILDYATRPLRKLFNFATSIQGVITGVLAGAAVQKAVVAPMQYADQLRTQELAFKSLLGSEEKAKDMIERIKVFDEKSPFDSMEIIKQSRMLMTYKLADEVDVLEKIATIGDTAMGVGAGAEGIERITRALGQMRAKGKVAGEEMMQLSEINVSGWDYLAQEFYGKTEVSGKELQVFREQMEKSKNTLIDVDTAINAIFKGMQRDYGGQAGDLANETIEGVWGQIESLLKNGAFLQWGIGLKEGTLEGMKTVAKWLEEAKPMLKDLGNLLEDAGRKLSSFVTEKLVNAGERFKNVMSTDEFKTADFWGKLKLSWNAVIVEPFSQWWSSEGKQWASDTANKIGSGIGGFLKGGILALLGISIDGSSVVSDGLSVGASFAEGFLQGFDPKTVGKAIVNGIKGLFKDAFTFGENRSSTAGLSTAILGIGAYKLGGKHLLKGIPKLLTNMKNAKNIEGASKVVKGATGKDVSKIVSNVDDYTSFWEKSNLFNINKREDVISSKRSATRMKIKDTKAAGKTTQAFSKVGNFIDDIGVKLLKPVSKLSPFLKKAGTVLKGSGLQVLFSGLSIAAADDKVGETAKQAGGIAGSLGGAKLGAMAGGAIGSIIPGIGTAIGTAIGGVIGGIGGFAVGEGATGGIYDFIKSGKLTEWFNSTGESIANWYNESKNKVVTWFKETGESAKQLYETTKDNIISWATKKGDDVKQWFKNLPESLAYSVGQFVGTAERKINEWSTYWTTTVPEYWNNKINEWSTYWTTTVPEYWNNKINEWSTYWTTTVPEYWNNKINEWSTYWTTTVPEYWNNKINEWGTYWTTTVPEYWNSKVDELSTWWSGVTDYWKVKIDEIGSWFSGIPSSVGNFFNNLGQKMVNAANRGREDAKNNVNNEVKIERKSNPVSQKLSGYATGTNWANKGLHWVGENGPELVNFSGGERVYNALQSKKIVAETSNQWIANSPKNSIDFNSGKENYNSQQDSKITTGSTIQLGGIHINVNGGRDSTSVIQAIRENMSTIANELCNLLSEQIGKTYENMAIVN